MARDLNDLWGWVQQLVRRVARLESGASLERSSITNGRMRFIGGLLRLDSGALLELVGQWRFFGNGAITGDVYSEGKWTQVGDYDFTGDGDLAGNVTMSGDFDLTGIFKSGNVRIEDGKIYVGAGPVMIVIDGATGKITAGNVTIEQNKITVAGGASPATLQEGKMSFGTGGTVEADTGVGGARMTAGDAVVNVGSTASIRKGSSSVIVGSLGIDLNPAGDGDINMLGTAHFDISTIPQESGTGTPAGTLRITTGGYLRRSDGT